MVGQARVNHIVSINDKSKLVLSKFGVLLVAIVVSVIAKDSAQFIGVLFYYLLGICFRSLLLENSRERTSAFVYDILFSVYVLLVILTQIQLIHDPEEDFYFHNDAAWSFYKELMDFVLPCKWSELLDKTLLNPFFVHFPLAMTLWGAFGKVGLLLGVESLRLFMRFQGCVFSALIVSMICNLLRAHGIEKSRVTKYSILLGICTYVFIASATFTRDVLVMFSYVYITYVYLYPNVRRRLIKMIIGILLAFGFRPENGYIAVLFLAAYYYPIIKAKLGAAWILIPVILIVAAFPLIQNLLDETDELFSYYVDYIHDDASSSGIFMKVYELPFPINQIILLFYVIIQPLPFFAYVIGDGMSVFNITTIVMPFINVWAFSIPFFHLFSKNCEKSLKYLILVLLGIYAITVIGSPDMRRSFAVFPTLFTISILVKDRVPQRKVLNRYVYPLLFVINCAFSFYLYI